MGAISLLFGLGFMSLWVGTQSAPNLIQPSFLSRNVRAQECGDVNALPNSDSYTLFSSSKSSLTTFPSKISDYITQSKTGIMDFAPQAVAQGLSIMAVFLTFFLLLALFKYVYVFFRRQQSIHTACSISNCSIPQSHKKLESLDLSHTTGTEADACTAVGTEPKAGIEGGMLKGMNGFLAHPILIGLLGSPDWEVKVAIYIDENVRQQKQKARSQLVSPPVSRPISFASASEQLRLVKPQARIRNSVQARAPVRPLSTPNSKLFEISSLSLDKTWTVWRNILG